jgi:hypothetical protein
VVELVVVNRAKEGLDLLFYEGASHATVAQHRIAKAEKKILECSGVSGAGIPCVSKEVELLARLRR